MAIAQFQISKSNLRGPMFAFTCALQANAKLLSQAYYCLESSPKTPLRIGHMLLAKLAIDEGRSVMVHDCQATATNTKSAPVAHCSASFVSAASKSKCTCIAKAP
mmetsp:Transcript_72827/g.115269  ORF Transcript_72827/g.115269 Transcript_72827/m.115269 type:complete len:105 (-) Transcript_72827:1028-1342(-)